MPREGDLIESRGEQILQQGGETADRARFRSFAGGSLGLGGTVGPSAPVSRAP